MGPAESTNDYSSTDNETSELVEKIKESTSETREELDVREIHDDDVLHFVIKKENLRQRIKRKLTGKTEGKDNETIRASKELLGKGIWAEIETETNHFWARIKIQEPEDGEGASRIAIRAASQKSLDDDNLLGLAEKEMFKDGTIAYLPNLEMTFRDKGKKGYNITAKSRGSIIVRKAEGLVGLWRDVLTNKELFVVFDADGSKMAEDDGGKEIIDLRNFYARTNVPCDFYRLGEEPFVCLDVEKMGYSDGE